MSAITTAKTIFQLNAKPTFFENIIARSSGTLLTTRQDAPELWEVDPITGTGECIVTLPDVRSLTGIAEVSPDVFAVGAGIYRLENHKGTVPGSYGVWTVDLTNSSEEPIVRHVAQMPAIGHLNGVAAWDAKTILVADSYNARIYSISLVDGTSSVFLEHEILGDPPKSLVKRLGVNGIKVHEAEGTKYVYFSNTTRMLLCRVSVLPGSSSPGEIEILNAGSISIADVSADTALAAIAAANDPDENIPAGIMVRPDNMVVTSGFVPDDFCFAPDSGAIYVTTHPTNMIFRIPPGGGPAIRVAGDYESWDVCASTACVFGRSEADRHILYVSTAGGNVIPIHGRTEPAKVVAIETSN